jgi:hypothetical protein
VEPANGAWQPRDGPAWFFVEAAPHVRGVASARYFDGDPMARRSYLLTILWTAACCACSTGPAGCRSVVTQSPINMDAAVATHGEPIRAWEVRDNGRAVGTLVRYAEADHPTRGFFSVRNLDQQILGIVDLEGRAWRYRPHVRDPEWLGSGTVAHATSWILGCSEACELVEVPLDSLRPEIAPHLD